MTYKAYIYPWHHGSGWQAHNYAPRTGKTLRSVLDQVIEVLYAGVPPADVNICTGRADYSVELWRSDTQLDALWWSDWESGKVTSEQLLALDI
jgi:hypothetical protein